MSNPLPVSQEALATSLLCLIVLGVGLALMYFWYLTRFFNELRDREPQTWKKIGEPTLVNMLFRPYVNSYKFYAFFYDLKARRNSDYQYAGKAYKLLCIGLSFCLLLIFNLGALVFSVFQF